MSKDFKDVFPPFIPGLRDVRFIEGETELSCDVRLATSNVLPFMRKTMRSVFSSAGIRVVANKKRFVINVNVVEPDELDYTGVSEALRDDYYEVHIVDNEVTVRTASQQGSIWGSQTFAHIYSELGTDSVIPNCRIRDWSHTAVRGVFFESCWGMESMGPEDWGAVMDRLVRSKLNTFGLTLVGSVNNPDMPGRTDIALPKIEAVESLATPVTLRYFSPQKRKWIEDPTLPRVHEMETVGNIFTLAREKGLKTVIGVNLPSYSRLVGGGGKLLAVNDAALRDQLVLLLDYAADRCMHKQNPYFLLSLDGFNSAAERKAFAASSSDVAELVAWLLPQLRERGLGRLVLWCDNFSGDDAVGAVADLKELAKAGEADHLTLGCRCGVECADIDAMKSAGVEIWNVASACTSSWSRYETCYDSIQAIGEVGRKHPEFGQIADAMYDPAWVDHGQLLACYTWNPDAADDMNGLLEQGIKARFGAFAHQYASAMQMLMKCLSENSALDVCFNRTEDPEAVKDYPMSALAALRAMPDAADQLNATLALAKQAREEFAVVAEKPKEELNDFMAKAAGSLAGEAARIEALAGCFLSLLGNENTSKARKALVAGMKLMEKYKPRFLVPAALANMSPLLTFLDSKK